MNYKYMKKQVEGAKALAEKYPHMQTHQDIYREHVEVLEKAKAFDEILNVDYIVAPDDYAHEITKIVDKYKEDKNNE